MPETVRFARAPHQAPPRRPPVREQVRLEEELFNRDAELRLRGDEVLIRKRAVKPSTPGAGLVVGVLLAIALIIGIGVGVGGLMVALGIAIGWLSIGLLVVIGPEIQRLYREWTA